VGGSPITPRAVSNIASLTLAAGRSGDIRIRTNNLSAVEGGLILSSTSGSGKGGDVVVDADFIELNGVRQNIFLPSAITASTFGIGQAGNLRISTSKLRVKDGGRIDSATISSGASGIIEIKARDSIEIDGTVPGSRNPSLIISAANILDSNLINAFGTPPLLTGESGSITISTQKLSITNGSRIAVGNDGTGSGGVVWIEANSINLDNAGNISAATVSGEGGDIFLNSQNLQLRDGSTISATAGLEGGGGNGGNITIDTDSLAALDGSSITANAFTGRGGNIRITTKGVFQSADSIFDASSRFGVDGTVELRSLGLEPDEALVPFNEIFIPMEQVVANSCFARRNKKQARFVVTGNGGLPESPGDSVMPMPLFSAEGLEPQLPPPGSASPADSGWQVGDPVVEATGIIKTKDGRTLLGMVGSSLPDAEAAICR